MYLPAKVRLVGGHEQRAYGGSTAMAPFCLERPSYATSTISHSRLRSSRSRLTESKSRAPTSA
jgi:hypothetical protein